MLKLAARNSKWCLVAGLVAGLTLPGLADTIRPHLPVMIAALLFLAAFRIGPDAVLSGLRSGGGIVPLVLIYQLVLPAAAVSLALLSGVMGVTAALAAVLMLSAPSVTGSANFALILRVPPEAALRLLMVGTALFPLTVIPVLLLIPALDPWSVLSAAFRLVVVVLLAGAVAFALRRGRLKCLSDPQRESVDGASAILLGVIVVGLMAGVAPLMRGDPLSFATWLVFAFVLNFGAQVVAWRGLAGKVPEEDRAASSIVAGNRNVALFLVALPPSVTDDLLGFIGCYQIPMYLTPILLRKLYARE